MVSSDLKEKLFVKGKKLLTLLLSTYVPLKDSTFGENELIVSITAILTEKIKHAIYVPRTNLLSLSL